MPTPIQSPTNPKSSEDRSATPADGQPPAEEMTNSKDKKDGAYKKEISNGIENRMESKHLRGRTVYYQSSSAAPKKMASKIQSATFVKQPENSNDATEDEIGDLDVSVPATPINLNSHFENV